MDQDAINLAKAIRKTESNDNYNAKGGSGENGAYQWMPATWKGHAKAVLGDENAPMTPDNQNAVAYVKIKQMKDQGLNPAQIAAAWNSGSPEGWEKKVGTNKQGQHYDVPAYVKKVTDNYQSIKGEGGFVGLGALAPETYSPTYAEPYTPTPTVVEPTDKNVGTITGGLNQTSQAIQDVATGKKGLLAGLLKGGEGLLRTAGGVAGGINEMTTKLLEKTPIVGTVVKGLEDTIGYGVGTLAKTSAGQNIIKEMSDFAVAHPDLSKDMEAGFNIATAIPILKGIGALKGVAKDATANALQNIAVKGLSKELPSAVTTKAGQKAVSALGEADFKTMAEKGFYPEIKSVAGKSVYDSSSARNLISKNIEDIEENEIMPIIKKASSQSNVSIITPVNELRKNAMNIAISNLEDKKAVSRVFDTIRDKYGSTLTLEEMHQAKILIGKQVKKSAWGTPERTSKDMVYQSLQEGVENGARRVGGGDIGAINKKMVKLFRMRDLLDEIDGKAIKNKGIGHQIIKTASTGAGGAIGGALGNTTLGGMVGYGTTGYVEGKLKGFTGKAINRRITKRAAKGATPNARTNIAKGIGTAAIVGGINEQ